MAYIFGQSDIFCLGQGMPSRFLVSFAKWQHVLLLILK